jgi:hypothetical protein
MCFGRNPRELHISVIQDSEPQCMNFSLKAVEKKQIAKEEIKASYTTRDDLTMKEPIRILQDWLSARYRRQAIPDDINSLLKDTLKLQRYIKSLKQELIGIWFDIDGPEGEKRTLTLYFIGNSAIFKAEARIEEKIKKIEEKNSSSNTTDIEVLCRYRSDLDISFNEINALSWLNFDYLCT